MAQTGTQLLSAHIALPLAEKVDLMAERLERSRGWSVREAGAFARLERSRGWITKQALSAWLDQIEEREQLTHEALADVDAGRVIDHQAVQAWADSLSADVPVTSPTC